LLYQCIYIVLLGYLVLFFGCPFFVVVNTQFNCSVGHLFPL